MKSVKGNFPGRDERDPEQGDQSHMRLVVLGTSQDAGFPHVGCRRACCEEAWTNPVRRRTAACLGIFDRSTGARWMFEATPNFPDQLHRLLCSADPEFRRRRPILDGIFLTHAHIGHYTGLMHLGREALGTRGVPLHVMPRMESFLRENGPWDQLVRLGNVQLCTLDPGRPVPLQPTDDEPGPVSVTAVPVPHRGEYSETVAFRIQGRHRSVLFLPDIDRWEEWTLDLAEVVAAHDVVYLDGSFYDESELPNRSLSEIPHPPMVVTMERLKGLSRELRARVRFLHFNHTNPVLHDGTSAQTDVHERGFRLAVEGEEMGI